MKNLYLIVTVGYDYSLLPRFLNYYKNIGIDNFLVILNTSDVAPIFILKNHGINAQKTWIESFSEENKQFHERNVILDTCSDDDWVVYADVDEFQHYPLGIENHIVYCENNNVDYLEGRLIDRISKTGKLSRISNNMSLDEQYPLQALLTNKLLKAWDKKITVAKGKLIVGGGHHVFLDSATYKPLPYKRKLNQHSIGIEVHHFKWDRSILLRMNRYLKLHDKSLFFWKKEMLRFMKHYSEYNGINIKDRRFNIDKSKFLVNI